MSDGRQAAAAEARRLAATLVGRLSEADERLLTVDEINVAPALEQVLFSMLRAGAPASGRMQGGLRTWSRLPLALAGGLRDARPGQADVVAVMLAGVHRRLFEPVADVLHERAPTAAIVELAAGRAARDGGLRDLPRLDRMPLPRSALRSVSRLAARGRFDRATRSWAAIDGIPVQGIRDAAHDALVRLTVEAARIDALLTATRPRVVLTYDEIDAWGRLLAAAARRHSVLSLDLPHAEAADADAIRGAAYDVMAVFGSRAAAVVRSAGFDARIVEVGAARFDALVRAGRQPLAAPLRVVVAGQYLAGRMTDSISARILEAAIAAAAAVAPAIVQVRPHPVEPAARWERLAAESAPRPGVDVRIEAQAELHDLLPGAGMLVTGWSNSVYEAVIVGVPAMTVHLLDGPPPMTFAAEGIACQATSPAEAARLAPRLLDAATRAEHLARAAAALEPHLGPLDGRATDRTAALVAELLAS